MINMNLEELDNKILEKLKKDSRLARIRGM